MQSSGPIPHVELARAAGMLLAERYAAIVAAPFGDESVSQAAADLVEAVIAEFRGERGVAEKDSMMIGEQAGLAFLSRIEEIEHARAVGARFRER